MSNAEIGQRSPFDRILRRRTAIPEATLAPRNVLIRYPAELCLKDRTDGRDPRDAVENLIRFSILAGRNYFHQIVGDRDVRLNLDDVDLFPIQKGKWSTVFRIGPKLTRLITANREDASEEEVNDSFLRGLNLYRRFEGSQQVYLRKRPRVLSSPDISRIDPRGVLESWNSSYQPIVRTETQEGTVFDTPY